MMIIVDVTVVIIAAVIGVMIIVLAVMETIETGCLLSFCDYSIDCLLFFPM